MNRYLFISIIAGAILTVIVSQYVHLLIFHDPHFTGFIVGNSRFAVEAGKSTVNGWIFDAHARLD